MTCLHVHIWQWRRNQTSCNESVKSSCRPHQFHPLHTMDSCPASAKRKDGSFWWLVLLFVGRCFFIAATISLFRSVVILASSVDGEGREQIPFLSQPKRCREPKCKESVDKAGKVLWLHTRAPRRCYDCSCPISLGMQSPCTNKTWTRRERTFHPSPCLGSTLSSNLCQSADGSTWNLLALSHRALTFSNDSRSIVNRERKGVTATTITRMILTCFYSSVLNDES